MSDCNSCSSKDGCNKDKESCMIENNPLNKVKKIIGVMSGKGGVGKSSISVIVAKQLKDFKKEVDTLIETNDFKKDEAIFNVLREYIKQTKTILFEGDGYSEAWEKEAKKRGLSNHKTTPKALKASAQLFKLFKYLSIHLFSFILYISFIKLKAYNNIFFPFSF